MGRALPDNERLLELLSGHATEGLPPSDDLELRRLLLGHPDVTSDELSLAAAAADRALARVNEPDPEPLPNDLRERVLLSAGDHLPARPERRTGWSGRAGWVVAAALLAVTLWIGFADRRPPGLPTSKPPEPTLAELREALLEQPDTILAAWARPDDPVYAGVEGDVVWSRSRQGGFMRLRGLPANLPTRAQYQLWIVDPARDAEPVDGGVFDVPEGVAEVIVPIDAKLAVADPQVFAITLEKPGGVVVSEGPLLVVASVTG